MSFKNRTATVFGGTGFLGSLVVRALARRGVTIKVATRAPERAYDLRLCGVVGQIVPFAVDYGDPKSIAAAIEGSDFVVNCIGILFQKRKGGFEAAHMDIPHEIARACRKHNVARFVHISALGIESNKSEYARTKREGEKLVVKSFPAATIMRPSVMFGPDDDFFNKFAELSRYLPALPLIGGGHTKFQPVFAGDVADAVVTALFRPDIGETGVCGQTYQLGGPEIVSFRQVYELMLDATGRRRRLVSIPWWLAKVQAGFMSLLPTPLLTPDQVESLKTDNVADKDAPGLAALGVNATSMELVLPAYLEAFRPGGRFGDRQAA